MNMITRTNIINTIINNYGCNNYLEIGVRDSRENYDLINCKNKDGVDPAPVTLVNFKMTSDEFFLNHVGDKKYDIVFVDGLHTAEQVYVDVINSIKYLNQGGFIVMHDCNPPTEYHIRSYEDYLRTRGQWNGTVFNGFIKLKQELKDWNCFVIDEDFGCGVLTQQKLGKDFMPLETVGNNITWDYFEKYRNTLLDLISYEDFLNVLK
jgi:hypothetical protein